MLSFTTSAANAMEPWSFPGNRGEGQVSICSIDGLRQLFSLHVGDFLGARLGSIPVESRNPASVRSPYVVASQALPVKRQLYDPKLPLSLYRLSGRT